jgi:hypothetical protein
LIGHEEGETKRDRKKEKKHERKRRKIMKDGW